MSYLNIANEPHQGPFVSDDGDGTGSQSVIGRALAKLVLLLTLLA